MGKKRIFKTDFGSEQPRLDPEAMFRDLKERAPDIKHLWSHQADILREYYNQHANTKDIAIELPTGTGKTLVGLLIAEFRRRTFNERVAYLCTTRQLAKQVTSQANQYGIKGFAFVGKQRDYNAGEFSEYQAGQAIAITNYSSVFNINPRISDANALILDDAHASENYLASMWSVEINRLESNALYDGILDLYKPALSEAFVASLSEDSPDHYRNIDVVPGHWFRSSVQALRDILDSQLDEDDSAWYAWHTIKQHLPACNMFIGGKSILLRPMIPPTLSHAPFCNANQRVFMSATLGDGGELERITGIKHIERIPTPSGWDKRGSGRRLFLLPQVALDEDDAIDILTDATKQMDRSLVLVPNQTDARVLRDILQDSDITVIGAAEIEDSIDVFGKSTGISLLLSRYDGLDLPDDTCRLLVFGGMPAGTNLQELFFLTRLAASSMLRDRILTRFTQGVGRCTRSDNDYAVVLLYGKALVDFILKVENRRILHPELQAEIEFGIENSKDKNPAEFAELWKIFLQRDEAWTEAEKAITGLREKNVRHSDSTVDRLRQVVADEVEYQYALWSGNYEVALEKAKAVADALGGDETKGYRGWWYYITGDAALLIHKETDKNSFLDIARDYFRRAGGCCIAISWFTRLARLLGEDGTVDEIDELSPIAVEAIQNRLLGWGLVGRKFEDMVSSTLADISSDSHREFHRGLEIMGQMLGFNAEIPGGEGAPDCVWSLGDLIHVVHEAKTEQTPSDSIGINDVRQAQSHSDWIKAHCPCNERTKIICVMETPRTILAKNALPHAKTLCRVDPEEIRTIAKEVTAALRVIRAAATTMGQEAILERILDKYREANLRPLDITERLSVQEVSKMPLA